MSDKVENAELVEVETDTDDVAGEIAGYDPKHVDLSPHRLASRVYSFGKGNYAVTDIDAKGIKTIALRLGISITKSSFKETSDDKGYYFTAKAVNLVTEQTAVDHVFQSKNILHGKNKGQFDEDALAKGATRVVRRARRQLIPEEVIDQAIEYAQIGKNTPDAVGTAKKEAGEARDRNKLLIKEMGLTAMACYEDAQEQMGPAENWGAAEWYALRDKYIDPETEFAHLVPKQKPKAQRQPAPEVDDRTKAINDVIGVIAELKEQRPDIAEIVLTDDDRIKAEITTEWFSKDSKNLDVGELAVLVARLRNLREGNIMELPSAMQPQPQQTTSAQADEVYEQKKASLLQSLNNVVNEVGNRQEFKDAGFNPNSIMETLLNATDVDSIAEILDDDVRYLISHLSGDNALGFLQKASKVANNDAATDAEQQSLI